MVKQIKGIFQFDVKNSGGTVQTWTLDLKSQNPGMTLGMHDSPLYLPLGPGQAKPDILISVGDTDMAALASGKLKGQSAFMSGKIKVKGNIMLGISDRQSNHHLLATKLDGLLKTLKAKL